jgi:hypothetical protein
MTSHGDMKNFAPKTRLLPTTRSYKNAGCRAKEVAISEGILAVAGTVIAAVVSELVSASDLSEEHLSPLPDKAFPSKLTVA